MIKIIPSIEDLRNPASKELKPCSVCGKSFHGNSALQAHIRRSHKTFQVKDNSLKQFYCPYMDCIHNADSSMPFTTFAAIKQHYKLVHGTQRFKCVLCGREFKTKYSCKQHEVDCGVKYVCSCDVAYTTRRGLLQHAKKQKHTIAEPLKSLFQQKKKDVKRKTQQSQTRQKYNQFILPKTLKKKVKLFFVNSVNLPNNIKIPTILNSSQLSISTSKVNGLFRPAVLTKPSVLSTQMVNYNHLNKNSQELANPQFPISDQTSRCQPRQGSLTAVGTNTIPNKEIDWMHKNISIQTEECFDDVNWLSIDDETNKILFENIATQTNISDFEPMFTETDSAMCQTEWCQESGCQPDLMFPGNHDGVNNHYSSSHSAENCDAQSQTYQSQTVMLPPALPPPQMNQNNVGFEAINNSSIFIPPSVCAMNTETQTDISVDQSTSETQTIDNIPVIQHDASTELESFEVFLNNIETQTDMLLPPWSSGQAGSVANSYTQTPGTDFLSEILSLEN